MLLFMSDVDLHDVQGELVLDVLAHVVTVLTMAIAHSKVPQILDLSEVFDNEEIVLICLGYTLTGLTWPCQICKLGHLVFNFPN